MHFNVGEEVHQLAQHGLVQRRAGVILGENTFEGFVGGLGLNGLHRVVDDLADVLRASVLLDVGPTGGFRHPKDVLCKVFLGVLGIGKLILGELIVHRLECFRDIFEEDQPQRDVFVFGRFKAPTHFVGCLEKVGGEVEISGTGVLRHANRFFQIDAWQKR